MADGTRSVTETALGKDTIHHRLITRRETHWLGVEKPTQYKSYCTVRFIPATGARSALNSTRQESIRRCIPVRRLKPLPGPSHLNIP
jgi:hypothetical protein